VSRDRARICADLSPRIATLSPPEFQVMLLVVEGHLNKQVSAALEIAVVAHGYCEWRPRLLRMTQWRQVGSALEEIGIFVTEGRCCSPATQHAPRVTVHANVAGASKVHANVYRPGNQNFVRKKLRTHRTFELGYTGNVTTCCCDII
jgi:hypothetical protein